MLTATSRQSWSYENMVLGPVVLGDWGNRLSPDDWGLVHARPLWIILEPGREGATTIVPMLQEYPIILVANGQLEKTARPPSQRLAQQGSGWCQCPTAIYTVPCGLRGCKNRPAAPFPGRMSYKATKPGSDCPVSYLRFLLMYILCC